ncbi:alkylhydroperoxidase AhpD family core domain-containing protein [Ekhidna lutea]|uniref:Alkylhydroperoxidase AhpD family core domain-containing protein n=1 Tax=Ekhidna lutea TaxID=447679 RepID=A0A239LFR0_EKHLU|nr:carboxymuconolactone decarboxylase family protein [Ekhidna lutea]SNT29311.1 alkylhydroperoxidase AhpD family core domain-containing protein [Ekhidna lutea]
MKNLEPLSIDQVSDETKEIFNGLKEKIGNVPNVYATIGNSSKALEGVLELNQTLSEGEFSGKEVETIALSSAQVNECNYCLSAHTTVGKMQGLTEEETVEIRNGEIEDKKLKALSELTKQMVESRGNPDQKLINNFFEVGYNKAALAELIGLIAVNAITNYTNHIAETDIDFPVAPELVHA